VKGVEVAELIRVAMFRGVSRRVEGLYSGAVCFVDQPFHNGATSRVRIGGQRIEGLDLSFGESDRQLRRCHAAEHTTHALHKTKSWCAVVRSTPLLGQVAVIIAGGGLAGLAISS
jgi:hypothetical protein